MEVSRRSLQGRPWDAAGQGPGLHRQPEPMAPVWNAEETDGLGWGGGGQGPADRKVDVIVKGPGGGSPEHRAARAGGRQPEGVQLHLWGLQVGQPAVWGQGDRAGCCSSQAWERHSLPGGPLNWGKWGGG